jgi:hypothetical protein
VAAVVANNHMVAGSSPAPATKINDSSKDGSFILILRQDSVLRREILR